MDIILRREGTPEAYASHFAAAFGKRLFDRFFISEVDDYSGDLFERMMYFSKISKKDMDEMIDVGNGSIDIDVMDIGKDILREVREDEEAVIKQLYDALEAIIRPYSEKVLEKRRLSHLASQHSIPV
jgi:hypothetical protein